MLPGEELFLYVHVLIHDLMPCGAIVVPDRPGPPPACTDAELLAIAIVQHLLGRRSEAGSSPRWPATGVTLFPRLPHQSEANRRTRWLWGAFEQIRITLAARLPEDDCQQADTSALPVKDPFRVRSPDQWTGSLRRNLETRRLRIAVTTARTVHGMAPLDKQRLMRQTRGVP